ncbi:MAG: ComEC/Rec2 family competence protein, partial [Rectinema sp.]|nr:ComEC/Rec2 family competence protein [Rectinema sp.]
MAVRIEPIARAPSKSSLARPGARLWAGSSVRLEGLQSDGGGRNEVIFAERIELLNGNQPGLAAWFARVRTSLAAGFSYAVSRAAGRAGPLANALLLGVKDDIDSEYRDLFRAAGCSHLLALSGQHLSIICALAAFVWKRLFRREGMVRRIALCFAWFFVWLAGPGPSLRRAAFMMSVNEIARTLDRPQRGIVALSLASLALALVSPPDLMSLSSIFSFSSMAGLIVLAPRAASMLRRWLPPFLAESLAASCAALCATAPVSMINFGMFSVAGILAAPVSGAVMLAFMWTALTAGVVAVFLPRISFVSAPILELLEKVLLAVLDIGSRIAPVQAASRDTQFLWLMIIAAFAALLYA